MKKQKIRKLPKFSRSISAKEYDLVLSNINKNGYVIVSNFLKKKILNFTYFSCSIINISINTHEIH